ncbi:ogr/Delta-like zinc finger family protein [Zymobacter sp. IVIA_5232.4 C2]|uniref:ogr/Delta-like zinc finger family protein n=1 Tax=Zymobacter sp. IVIA_5232.4 C2 TaxID=3394855 RepID=UPI0039C38B4D
MSKKRFNKPRLHCPHCGEFMMVRSSQEVMPTLRKGLVDCMNNECNFRGQFWFEIASTVAPSDMPNPDVHLEPTPFLQKRMAKQYEQEHQIDMFQPANDADRS